jgi:hypothetical protein
MVILRQKFLAQNTKRSLHLYGNLFIFRDPYIQEFSYIFRYFHPSEIWYVISDFILLT